MTLMPPLRRRHVHFTTPPAAIDAMPPLAFHYADAAIDAAAITLSPADFRLRRLIII
jgi:hypothetical protein